MSIVIPIIVGVVLMTLARHYNWRDSFRQEVRITALEFAPGAVIVVVIALLVTMVIGPNLARSSAVKGYHEFYNGSVVAALPDSDTCTRDGSCHYHYDCDPYWVKVVDRSAYTDSDGNYHSEESHQELRYHECPYVTREIDYVLKDNLGRTITIGDNYFEAHPQAWRSGHAIPSDVPRQPPDRWLQAKQNLARGLADPVTGVFPYANYILASDDKLYQQYDGAIAGYQKAGLLPKHTGNLASGDMMYDYDMRADKVQTAGGLKVSNLSDWQAALMRFNAALGSSLQGDMHIVLVPADKVSDPDDYITALKAYWTRLGKWSISKNGIILAIGVSSDGSTVAWSRASTGMPFGNGTMLTSLNTDLAGLAFNPNVLLGKVTASVRQEGGDSKVVYDLHSGGAIGNIVFVEYPFQRACMQCKDKTDKGKGFVDLKDEVPVSTGAKILMFFVVLVLSLGLWGTLLYTDPFGALLDPDRRNRFKRYPY